ncbi:hypothetical protein M23134_00407 [Microscilla marina ATCC 23134]|uniref:Uncharacterized protein n=1 Tax=Microscilla marina ATCC 23134 TaxID=313606 RepID=A1ZIY7_MICM2|nr:hypothetical protein M23134_00407 [Microscilla marina ATCC 23134]
MSDQLLVGVTNVMGNPFKNQIIALAFSPFLGNGVFYCVYLNVFLLVKE